MLTDNSLTNILTLSGISNVRYKIFSEMSTKEDLMSSLTRDDTKGKPILLTSHRQLIKLKIPSVWQVTPDQKDDTNSISIELWVFWFDDQTFDLIDKQVFLKELQETKCHSFSWNQWCSDDASPTSSPQLNKRNKSQSLTPGNEYQLFIKSIRNLIQNAMLTNRKGLVLGDFFIFPNETDKTLGTMIYERPFFSRQTMLAYTYNVYLTNSNLVFQPNVRRMRIRPLAPSDLNTTNLKVLLSPTGEYAKVLFIQSLPARDCQEKILTQWSEFYDIPIETLTQERKDIPMLITIRTASHDTIIFPSILAFVPTDTKQTPSAVAGMNGVMGYNRGLAEDLGAKLSRSVYYDRLKATISQNTVDYWSYHEPIFYSANIVIQTLSKANGKYQQNQIILNRALTEPVMASPIMNSKRVIPSDYDSPSKTLRKPSSSPPQMPESNMSQLGLAEFAQFQFGLQHDEDTVIADTEPDHNNMLDISEAGNAAFLSAMVDKNLTISSDVENQQVKTEPDQQNIQQEAASSFPLAFEQTSQQVDPEPIIDNIVQPTDYSSMMFTASGGQGSSWDANDDFSDLNMDLTEEDFDFFETVPSTTAPTTLVESALSHTGGTPGMSAVEADPFDSSSSPETIATKIEETIPTEKLKPVVEGFPTSSQPENLIMDENPKEKAESRIPQSEAVLQNRMSYQKSTAEPLTFMPRDFLPVPVNTHVNEDKYGIGGKFMYPSREITTKASHPAKRIIGYSPDYIPHFSLKKKSRLTENSVKNEFTDARMEETSSESSDDDSESTSSYSDSEYSSGSDNSSDLEKDTTNRKMIEKRFKALAKYQRNIVHSVLTPAPAPESSYQIKQMDYDTPFVRILSGDDINPIPWRQNKTMAESVANLCQQAVFGGYPFAGGLAEVSENGGEIEAELEKVLVARRTNLMQTTCGVVTHVPSLLTDVTQLTVDFKQLLNEIFIHKAERDPMEEVEPVAFMNEVPLGKISVKGPLNVRQYYDLNDTQNQPHAKYGKYQVKKKRPNAPNLDNINPSDIVVSRQEEFLEGSHNMLRFWDKLGLEPYSAKKDVQYFVIFPSNPDVEFMMQKFFRELSIVYESCYLGKHRALDTKFCSNGMVPVPLSPMANNESYTSAEARSYEIICEKLAFFLPDNSNHTVIYIVNPGPHMSSYLDMSRCFYKLQETYRKMDPKKFELNQSRLVLQIVPIDHILRNSAFGGHSYHGLKDIAFSVYSKCPRMVNRKTEDGQYIWRDIYSPPFVLPKPMPTSIKYKLDDLRNYPVLLDQNAKLHMAYCFSYDRACMIVVWTDDRGELLEYSLFNTKTAYKDACDRTKKITQRTGYSWSIALSKIGLMFNDELLMWRRAMTDMDACQITIVAIDLESTLNIHFAACYPGIISLLEQHERQPAPSFLDAKGNSHYNVGSSNYSTAQNEATIPLRMTQAQMLVLNHRVSYTEKREKTFKGILKPEAITEKENWMTPLATGYLIHHSLPDKNVNPCMEQFNNEPFVAEIHLLYNQTSSSAYSTLQNTIRQLYALSFVNPVLSSRSCIPYHIVVAERLSRLLLIVDGSMK